MAKKRKKEKAEVEEYEFIPPEFDEKDFLKKELRDIRVGLITVLLAVVLGVAAGALSMASNELVIVSFFIGIAGVALLKQFYTIIGVDTSEFKKKHWAGNIATLFFTFLAIWVLILNMPFTDHANPDIEEVVVWVDDGSKVMGIEWGYVKALGTYDWVSMDPDNYTVDSVIHASATYTVNITARVTDNGKLSTVTISQISSTIPPTDMIGEEGHRFGYKVGGDKLGSALSFYITATDSEGNSEVFHPTRAIVVLP